MPTYSERAKERPIEGMYRDFAIEIRHLLGWTDTTDRPFISTRTAARKTGLSNGTIANMAHGDPTTPESIHKFVTGIGGDEARLCVLAGHLPPQMKRDLIGQDDPSAGKGAQAQLGDPLHQIGADIDVSGLLSIASTEINASADPNTDIGEGGQDEIETRDLLPQFDRTIRVKGDCMQPYYQNGDILFIRLSSAPDPGATVVAEMEGAVLCKQYRRDSRGPYLEATNGGARIRKDFRIIGTVEGFFRIGK